jgi:hypothetical protein
VHGFIRYVEMATILMVYLGADPVTGKLHSTRGQPNRGGVRDDSSSAVRARAPLIVVRGSARLAAS